MQLRRLHRTNICERNNENIGHSSWARNGDRLDQLIKTGSTQNERTMLQTIIRTF